MRLANEGVVAPRRLPVAASAGRRRTWGRVLTWTILLAGAVLMMMPLIWMLSSSLKVETRVFEYPPRLIPEPVRFANYVDALTYKPFHLYLKNTLFLVIMNEIAVLGTASFCAYGFARIDFKGRDFWFTVLLAVMMLPNIVLMVPSFVIFSRLHWIDTFLPLVIPPFFGGGAFNIFLLRQFFRSIPEDLSDAARIDGCNDFGIYARVMLPLAKPALTTVGIFTFIGAWNNFMGPLLYFNSSENYTVSIGLAMFRSVMRTRWDLLMAASAAMTLPMIIVFFAAQRYFVQGIVLTGLKG